MEDLISRQAVLDLFGQIKEEYPRIYTAVECSIRMLPSVNPQPKTGHWKRIGYDIYECSICGQNVQTGDICAYKHCHGCGARMESEE